MKKSTSLGRKHEEDRDRLDVGELERQIANWLFDGEAQNCTKATLANRRNFAVRILWFVKQREYPTLGRTECRAFLAYLNTGHDHAGGRWGNPGGNKPLRPASAKTYHKWLKAFLNFCVAEGAIDATPMEGLAAPIVNADQIQPFSPEEVVRLLAAARRSNHPRRDETILLILLDTGLRASELCALRSGDVDLDTQRIIVREGKGRKGRVVFCGRQTRKAIYAYRSSDPKGEDDFLFMGERGTQAGEPLTRFGLRQLFARLGERACIKGTRCSPHTCRHTAAVSFLRNGGNVFALQQMLGHTGLDMTRRYVALVEGDLEAQHRQYSPVERLLRKNR